MQVSRYIHRSPLDAGIASQLDRYRWSSYPFYVRRLKPEPWLHCDAILNIVRGRKARYRAFVEQFIDEELAEFYAK
jgi:putative transposase